MSSLLGEMHKVCGYHFSPSHYSLKTLSAAIQCCECLLVRPRDGNLTHNGDPRVGTLAFENLKMSYFPWAVLPPPLPHPVVNHWLVHCMFDGWTLLSSIAFDFQTFVDYAGYVIGTQTIGSTSCPGRDFAILGEIPKRHPSSWRVYIKRSLQLQYTVSMQEKNLNLLAQGPHGIFG